MTTPTPASTSPSSRRPLPLAILDIAAGIIIGVIGLATGIGVLATVAQFGALEGGNEGLRSATSSALIAVVIFGWAIPSGMFLVRAIQRRYAFYWPIIGLLIVIISFYIGTAIVGSTVAVCPSRPYWAYSRLCLGSRSFA